MEVDPFTFNFVGGAFLGAAALGFVRLIWFNREDELRREIAALERQIEELQTQQKKPGKT